MKDKENIKVLKDEELEKVTGGKGQPSGTIEDRLTAEAFIAVGLEAK